MDHLQAAEMIAKTALIELAKALAKAQGDFKPIKKTAVNPHFKSKYAPLENVIEATQPALQKNGLAIVQLPGPDTLTTILLHESGERIEAKTPIIADRQGPQGYGSALTYARRYAWSAILGVASEDDDDGNTATAPKQAAKPNKSDLKEKYIDLVNRAESLEQWQQIGKWLVKNNAPPAAMKQYNSDMQAWENLQEQEAEELDFLKGLELPEKGGE